MFLILYSIFHIIVRVYIFAKVFYLLVMNFYYPELYPIGLLTWWIYFMIFDIWLEQILPKKEIIDSNKKQDDN